MQIQSTVESSTAVAPTKRVLPPLSPRKFVAVVAACMGFSALSIDLALPAFADIRSEFGLAADSSSVSSLITMYFLGLAAGQVVFGPMSDRFGRKPILCVGFSVCAIGAFGAALAPSLAGVYACRVLWGVGAAAPRSVAMAMVRDTQQGKDMARTMSMAMAVFLIVPILAPTAGELMLLISPWRIVFVVPGVAALAIMAWIMRRLPETLAVEHRRSVSPKSLLSALGQVLRNRQTAGLGLAIAFLFGAMTTFIGSAELLVGDVFDRSAMFALLFGLVGCVLGAAALLNARLVMRYGVDTMLKFGSLYVVVAGVAMFAVSRVNDGAPPLWMFWTSVICFMPGVSMLTPNCNSAAMVPLPHVAGMASAVLGAVSIAGGAVLGSVADNAFDGTVGPFATHALIYAVLGSLSINVLAHKRRTVDAASVEPVVEPVGVI
ncbi:MAG TPA: multidrug effflux MFS transporter [Ilumatobacter sp.]|nr:multidrug effflux MFS transporter [Ilumatobacter sp.]